MRISKPHGKKKSDKFIHCFLMIVMFASTVSQTFFLPSMVSARPLYAKDLPPSLKNYCQVCHTAASGGPLNKFGMDYQKFNFDVNAISSLDSDGDGFTNGEELAEGTLPGNPNSYPGAPQRMPMIELTLIAAGLLFLLILIWIWRHKT